MVLHRPVELAPVFGNLQSRGGPYISGQSGHPLRLNFLSRKAAGSSPVAPARIVAFLPNFFH